MRESEGRMGHLGEQVAHRMASSVSTSFPQMECPLHGFGSACRNGGREGGRGGGQLLIAPEGRESQTEAGEEALAALGLGCNTVALCLDRLRLCHQRCELGLQHIRTMRTYIQVV